MTPRDQAADPMTAPALPARPPRNVKGRAMDVLILLGIFAGWIVLQIWVLPRFGIQT
ncbi:MAG TPA: hypothetical protein PKD86_12910 [Gemmatales bacterium]|nr:hypothetical protein [Gemmatales bacterium]HMP60244.1 hypothetical protein [Gemmatales bacterium]